MPIYEYECPKCGIFEVVQKASDKPLKAKPECDQKNCPKKAQRLISPSAFHLKGGGWYKTDYASSSNGSSSKKSASKESSGSEASTDSGSTEKKSEAKSETKKETAKSSAD